MSAALFWYGVRGISLVKRRERDGISSGKQFIVQFSAHTRMHDEHSDDDARRQFYSFSLLCVVMSL